MAMGASGNRVVVLGKVLFAREAEEQPGMTQYVIQWQLSEPVIDSTTNATMTHSEESVITSVQPTDSEIMAELRGAVVRGITRELAPADPFIDADVRGCTL